MGRKELHDLCISFILTYESSNIRLVPKLRAKNVWFVAVIVMSFHAVPLSSTCTLYFSSLRRLAWEAGTLAHCCNRSRVSFPSSTVYRPEPVTLVNVLQSLSRLFPLFYVGDDYPYTMQ